MADLPKSDEERAAEAEDQTHPETEAIEGEVLDDESTTDDVATDDDNEADDDLASEETESLETPEAGPEPESEPREIERVIETRRGGFFPALLGGIIAAVLGFLVARSDLLDPILPAGLRGDTSAAEVETLRTTLNEQSARIDTLAARDIPDLAPVTGALDDLKSQASQADAARDALAAQVDRLAPVADRVAALGDRVTALEKRPVDDNVSQDAIAAYERELAKLGDSVRDLRAEVEALLQDARTMEASAQEKQASAEAAAIAAQVQNAVARLRVTAASGAPYAADLAKLRDLGVQVPQSVAGSAETGLVSLATLAETFPEAARKALAAARSATGATGGLAGYLQRQLGARSVAPRDGDDPDAVLSRAEAAILSGDLAAAMAEIETLPDTARAEMATWTSQAETRQAILADIDALAQNQNSN